jgi:hypothetical protein
LIITLEGAPAVGKSTVAAALGCPVVPEVNRLFGKKPPGSTGHDWYLQRQLDRWQQARRAASEHGIAVLDGDFFQPVWFAALFWQENWGDSDATARFFRRAVQLGAAGIPDRFVVLTLAENERGEREAARCSASGRLEDYTSTKISRYSAFAAFQGSLFDALDRRFPGLVSFVESGGSIAATTERVRTSLQSPQSPAPDALDFMVAWCSEYKAEQCGRRYGQPK